MEHTYKQIDEDGTVECTKCGLRNSDLTQHDYIECETIDNMSIEEIEQLAEMLSEDDRNKWASSGYDGASYVKITKNK